MKKAPRLTAHAVPFNGGFRPKLKRGRAYSRIIPLTFSKREDAESFARQEIAYAVQNGTLNWK